MSTKAKQQALDRFVSAKLALVQAELEVEAASKALLSHIDMPNEGYEGTQRVRFLDGVTLKLEHRWYSYIRGSEAQVKAVLKKVRQQQSEELADRVIKWEPRLILGEYRYLKPGLKRLLDRYIERKPGKIGITIE